jgi:hypothetical protein
MPVTCQDVAKVLAESGKERLANDPELAEHVAGCDNCVDLLIHHDAIAAGTAPPISPPDLTADNAAPQPGSDATPPAESLVPAAALEAAPLAPTPTLEAAPAAPAATPDVAPPGPVAALEAAPPPEPAAAALAPPPRPPPRELAPTPKTAPAPAPAAKAKAPQEWLPSLSPSGIPEPSLPPAGAFPASDPWAHLQRRMSMKIKPIHFWMGSVVSAIVGAGVVLAAILIVNRQVGWFGGQPVAPPAAPPPAASLGMAVVDLATPANDTSEAPDKSEVAESAGGTHGGPRLKSKGKSGSTKGQDSAAKGGAGKELTQKEVLTGVKENVPKLAPCLEAARKANEMAAGKQTLIFSFTILPNGSVKGGKLDGPASLMNTSVSACFATKLKVWKFPPSAAGAAIKNFPLPVNLK